MRKLILLFAAVILAGCATASLPVPSGAKIAKVYVCDNGSYSLHVNGVLPLYPMTHYPCAGIQGYKTVEAAFYSRYPSAAIDSITKVDIGGLVANGHTEYRIVYR